MKDKFELVKLKKDFLAFKHSSLGEVPSSVYEQTKCLVLNRLNPSPYAVFRKLSLIHGIFGVLSLAVCHQMGMNPFGTSFSLHSLFMDIMGHMGCTVFCGFWFVGGSVAASYFFLSQEEVKSLKDRVWLQSFMLSLISLIIFGLFGAKIFILESLLWLAGALVGGLLATRILNRRFA